MTNLENENKTVNNDLKEGTKKFVELIIIIVLSRLKINLLSNLKARVKNRYSAGKVAIYDKWKMNDNHIEFLKLSSK